MGNSVYNTWAIEALEQVIMQKCIIATCKYVYGANFSLIDNVCLYSMTYIRANFIDE